MKGYNFLVIGILILVVSLSACDQIGSVNFNIFGSRVEDPNQLKLTGGSSSLDMSIGSFPSEITLADDFQITAKLKNTGDFPLNVRVCMYGFYDAFIFREDLETYESSSTLQPNEGYDIYFPSEEEYFMFNEIDRRKDLNFLVNARYSDKSMAVLKFCVTPKNSIDPKCDPTSVQTLEHSSSPVQIDVVKSSLDYLNNKMKLYITLRNSDSGYVVGEGGNACRTVVEQSVPRIEIRNSPGSSYNCRTNAYFDQKNKGEINVICDINGVNLQDEYTGNMFIYIYYGYLLKDKVQVALLPSKEKSEYNF